MDFDFVWRDVRMTPPLRAYLHVHHALALASGPPGMVKLDRHVGPLSYDTQSCEIWSL